MIMADRTDPTVDDLKAEIKRLNEIMRLFEMAK